MTRAPVAAPELLSLERATERAGGEVRRARPLPAWVRLLLGVPLPWKLLGLNVLIGLLTAAAVVVVHDQGAGSVGLAMVLVAALAVSILLSFLLVRVALRPLATLEATAAHVWRGDFAARVPASPLADREMARVGTTLNLLLDGIERDRERMRRLASQIIAAQDEERSRVARELHDSVAQTMAALVLQLGAARRAAEDPALARQLDLVREIAGDALEEVRLLSHTVYPRVLDDLGLAAALEWLARSTQEADGLRVTVDAAGLPPHLPNTQGAALYRVAQEALRNVVRHADARHVLIRARSDDTRVTLDVRDDGAGFDVGAAEERRPGMGLFAMRERIALVDGTLEIESAPAQGTRVRAIVPLDIPTPTPV
jgi:signal transduction histidine kinase